MHLGLIQKSKTGEAVTEWSWPLADLVLVVSGPYARFEYFQFPEHNIVK